MMEGCPARLCGGIAWARRKVQPQPQGLAARRVQSIWASCMRFPTSARGRAGATRRRGRFTMFRCARLAGTADRTADGARSRPHGARRRRATNGRSAMLARRHAAGAHGLARRILGSEALAEEIVQDALLRVWINAPRWRPEAAFRTWLYRIVVNLCLNAKRRPADLPLAAAGDPADPAPDADAALEQRERDRRLAAAIEPCRRASAPRSCSPIRKGSATPRPRPCSTRRSPASRRCWSAPGVRCARRLAESTVGGAHENDHELEAALAPHGEAARRRRRGCGRTRHAASSKRRRCRRRSAPWPGGPPC